MRLIDFSKIGGYRLKQKTFRYMQEAYYWILKSFIGFLNLPDVGNYIIYGCKVVGPNITSGMMYIDGELCPFTSVAGTDATKIKKLITNETLAFKNGNNENVFRQTTAIVDASGTALSAFNQLAFVQDANYVHTDNNFTIALLNKLLGIETGAEVNVQTDWNVTNPALDSYLLNKPLIQNILHEGEIWVSDFPNSTWQRITIPIPDVGTVDYKAEIHIKSLSALPSAFQDAISYCTSNYKSNSFDIVAAEHWALAQNCTIYYTIIKL